MGNPTYDLPESQKNMALAGGSANLYMVLDSDRQLIDGKLRPPQFSLIRTLRRIEVRLTPPGGERSGSALVFRPPPPPPAPVAYGIALAL